MSLKHISISSAEKIGLISNFSTMLSAGISLLETIDSLLEDAKGNTKKILETIRADTTQGKYLSVSFTKFPRVFDTVTVNIIKASEEAGTLDTALKDLKENIKKDAEFVNKVRAAMIYPGMIMLVFFGVLVLMLTFVIPRISSVFLRMKVELPLPTKVLIAASNGLLENLIPLGIGAVFFVGVFVWLFKTNRNMILRLFFSLPLIDKLALQIDLTRFSRSLHLLLSAGIPLTTALSYAQEVVMMPSVNRALKKSQEIVTEGRKLSEGFKKAKNIFPGIVIKITEAGEKTGSLDRSMKEIAEYLDYQVSNTLRTLLTLMEPVMLVLVGVMVGGMMLSIIAPIYNIIGQVGAG